VTAPPNPDLARILADLAAVGRKLVETSESALALLERAEAQCVSPETPMPASPTETLSALMTRREVAALLRIEPRTLSRLRADPEFEFPDPVHVGSAVRWRRSSVMRWVAARSG
jgi:predicted DNA-binding transcriptional regulator AlpA